MYTLQSLVCVLRMQFVIQCASVRRINVQAFALSVCPMLATRFSTCSARFVRPIRFHCELYIVNCHYQRSFPRCCVEVCSAKTAVILKSGKKTFSKTNCKTVTICCLDQLLSEPLCRYLNCRSKYFQTLKHRLCSFVQLQN